MSHQDGTGGPERAVRAGAPPRPAGHEPVLRLTGIEKHFGPVVALDGADFEVRAGEVHALLGENGAGKTTMMNIASGVIPADAGTISFRGVAVSLHSPADATRHGLGMVHQHFRLVRTMTVAQNIHLGWRECPFRFSEADLERRTAELSERLHFDLDPHARIAQLPVSDQQRVAILRALARGAEVLVLDEPTSALSPGDAERLLGIVRRMAGRGRTVVFISHKLHEVLEVADRITVLRAGRRVTTLDAGECDVRMLARLMVGHQVDPVAHRDATPGVPALVATGVSARGDRGLEALHGVDLTVRHTEILGVAGVAGNGQAELAEVLTGMRDVTGGSVSISGRDMTATDAGAFIEEGVGHVPEELRTGLVLAASVEANAAMKRARRAPVRRGLLVSRAHLRALAERLLAAAGLGAVGGARRAGTLSGGQAQRLVVQRELDSATRVLVVVNGTLGLDVAGAKQVHERLVAARDAGLGVLLISEDLDELLALSDRLVVLFKGRVVGEFDRSAFDRERIGMLMGGAGGALHEAGEPAP